MINITKKEQITGSLVILLFCAITFVFGWCIGNYKNQFSEGSCNICLGYKAGEEITTENFQFRFTVPEFVDVPVEANGDGSVRCVKSVSGLWEYSATMTPEEYERVFAVIDRAKRLNYYKDLD